MLYIFNNVYVLLFFCIFFSFYILSSVAFLQNKKSVDQLATLLVYITFQVLIFNKYGQGPDEIAYLDRYLNFDSSLKTFSWGPSFYFIYYFSDLIGIDKVNFKFVVPFVYSTLISLLTINLVKNNMKGIILTLLLFSVFSLDFSFNVYRQGLATVSFLFAITLYSRSKLLFLLFSLIAAGFHWSILSVFIIFIASRFLHERLNYYLLVVSVFLTTSTLVIEIDFLIFLQKVLSFFDFSVLSDLNKINHYLNPAGNSFYNLNIWGKVQLLLPIIFSMVFVIYNYRKLKSNNLLPFFIAVSIYSYLFIGMAYSFRNYYWMLIVFPFLLEPLGNDRQENTNITKQDIVILVCLFMLSVISTFNSAILKSIYPA